MPYCKFLLLAGFCILFACSPGQEDDGSGDEVSIPSLTRIFPQEGGPNQLFPASIVASPLLVWSRGEPFVLVTTAKGLIMGVHPKTGERIFEIHLPAPEGRQQRLRGTPVQFGDKIALVQQVGWSTPIGHRVAIVDLDQRRLDPTFPIVELHAEKTGVGTGVITFNPPTASSHATPVHGAGAGDHPGYIYVSFGGFRGDIQPWHGWVFELDLAAWQSGGEAISGVLLTTPEDHCPVAGQSGASGSICGGGVWAPAGPQIHAMGNSFELLVPTGNGQLDLARGDYAQTLMRVGPGLEFDPRCDEKLCEAFNPGDPDLACLESCVNLFVPRLQPGDDELRPVSGVCDNKTFWECINKMDYDFGANAPAIVAVPNGPTVYVQPGKEGAVYLIDAERMGTLYDREQVVGLCGAPGDECEKPWTGMITATQPAVTEIDGTPVVIVPTFIPNETQPAGLVALKIVLENGKPRLEPFWQAPDFSTRESQQRFRFRSTRVALAPFGAAGEIHAWVADHGTILGVRVHDGQIVARQELLSPISPDILPLIYDGILYVITNQGGRGTKGRGSLEAYAIGAALNTTPG